MGIDKITKLLKRCNKGKNTITMSIVVAFLLGSNLSYGDIKIKVVSDESGKNIVKIYETKLENGNETDEFTLNNLDVTISDNTSGDDNDKITLTFALEADKEQENNGKLQNFKNKEVIC